MSLTYQFAIRMPDGELYRGGSADDGLGLWYSRLLGSGVETKPAPVTWNTKEAAESQLETLRKRASALGIHDWLGVIVQRVCSPFSSADPAEDFVTEINEWMEGREP